MHEISSKDVHIQLFQGAPEQVVFLGDIVFVVYQRVGEFVHCLSLDCIGVMRMGDLSVQDVVTVIGDHVQ
jgi:hypothetical protein